MQEKNSDTEMMKAFHRVIWIDNLGRNKATDIKQTETQREKNKLKKYPLLQNRNQQTPNSCEKYFVCTVLQAFW